MGINDEQKNKAIRFVERQKEHMDEYFKDTTISISRKDGFNPEALLSGYTIALHRLGNMVNAFFFLYDNGSLKRRMESQLQDKSEKSTDVVVKLDLLATYGYQGSSLMDNEIVDFKDNIARISRKIRSKGSDVVTADIETLHDISEFIYKRLPEMNGISDEKKQAEHPDESQASTVKSSSGKMTIDQLLKVSKDDIYRKFAGKKIFKFINEIEKTNSNFDVAARAYQHTNEPMHKLHEDLSLNLEGKTVLAITCSGDPVGIFAALGAKKMVCFDTSYKATLFGEFKAECIKALSFDEYRRFFGIDGEVKGGVKKVYEEKIRPGLSEAARASFDILFKKYGSNSNINEGMLGDEKFFRSRGFSGSTAEANLFSQSKKHYEKAKKNLKNNSPIFIPGSIADLASVADTSAAFDAVYLSNAPDHFRNKSGEIEPSEDVLKPFYALIDGMLKGKGSQVILNFQWGHRAVPGSRKAFDSLGYDLKLSEGGLGCGNMAIAEKKYI